MALHFPLIFIEHNYTCVLYKILSKIKKNHKFYDVQWLNVYVYEYFVCVIFNTYIFFNCYFAIVFSKITLIADTIPAPAFYNVTKFFIWISVWKVLIKLDTIFCYKTFHHRKGINLYVDCYRQQKSYESLLYALDFIRHQEFYKEKSDTSTKLLHIV